MAAPHGRRRIPGCAKDELGLNLVDSGRSRIGTDNPAFPPWFGGDEKKPWKVSDPYSGKGYESAVAYAVAKQLGFAKAEVKWTVTPFNNSFRPGQEAVRLLHHPGVDHAGACEGGHVQQAVLLRQPGGRGRKGKPIAKVKTIAGLRPYKLGVQIGTTSYDYIVKQIKPSSKPLVYDTNDAVTALKNGQIDGLVVDLPTAFYVTAVQVSDGKVVGQFKATGEGAVRARAAEGQQADGVREQGARPAVGQRDDQEPPAHLARQGDRRARPEVAALNGSRNSRILGGATAPVSKEARAVAIALLSTAVFVTRSSLVVTRSPGGGRSRRTSSTGASTRTASRRSWRRSGST